MTLITKGCPLWPYLVPYVCAAFTMCFVYKVHVHQLYGLNCHTKREKPKTCLTNHKGSVSHPIMPLVINSLEGRQTHMHTDIVDKSNFKKPVMHQCVPGLKSN